MTADSVFGQLAGLGTAYATEISVWFCAEENCENCNFEEAWHVLCVTYSAWNEEPFVQLETYTSQADAWQATKELGQLWMTR